MSFLIGLLSVLLALNCVLLILLVLIQLPKKEAGAGVAFGGSATDALFGAGSGNALTKITKYSAGVFFALAILISLMQTQVRKSQGTIKVPANWQPPRQPAPAPASTPETAPAPVTAPLISTNATLSFPVPTAAPAAATNAPTP